MACVHGSRLLLARAFSGSKVSNLLQYHLELRNEHWHLPRQEGTRSSTTRSCSSSKVNQFSHFVNNFVCSDFESQQSVRQLTHVFFETSIQLASQWSRIIEKHPEDGVEIEITNWAGRFA
jgi:hypothetical protein